MKKIYGLYKTVLLVLMMGGFIWGCGENENFSTLHELTDEEIKEIARQDSIEEAQKNKINADLILEYSVEITISQTLYDGTTLSIDLDKIADVFGITQEELIAGIAGEEDALEIKGFAINGTTRIDYATSSNTNSPWGHWWDANGDVVSWGDNAMLFAEFDTENGVFYVGQFPGHLIEDQTITIIEGLKFNDTRVAVVITVTAKGLEEITATVVNTQEINVNVYPRLNTNSDSLHFDLNQVFSDLGVSSMNEISFIAVNQDGSYNQEPAVGNLYWFNSDGYVGTYGEDAVIYVDYGEYGDDKISIGQFPGSLTEGDEIVVEYGFLANDKIEMLEVTVKVVAYDDPEVPEVGDPENLEADIVLSKPYSNDYSIVTFDIKEIMKKAFKSTTYQVGRAIVRGELKLYQGSVEEATPSYTADVPGYWLDADGMVSEWASGAVWCSIGYSESELYLFGGNHPDNAEPGDTVSTKLIATYNGGSVTFNITFKIE